MNYNDEELLSPNSYQEVAKAYQKSLQNKGFVFVSLDNSKEEAFLHEVMELFYLIKSNLFALGGFLGTGALYNLNEKEIAKMQSLYTQEFNFPSKSFSHDKVKCFLSLLSSENKLINKLICLAEQSTYSTEILEIIKERTQLSSSLFKANSLIS